MDASLLDYLAVLGGLVGAGELASRYRDAPGGALYTRPAVFYILLNVAASLAMLALTRIFGWTPATATWPWGLLVGDCRTEAFLLVWQGEEGKARQKAKGKRQKAKIKESRCGEAGR